MNNFPDISTMEEMAISMHELYVSFVKGGFDENQALAIVIGAIIAGAGR